MTKCGCATCGSISNAYKIAKTGACDKGHVCDGKCETCDKYGVSPICITVIKGILDMQRRLGV